MLLILLQSMINSADSTTSDSAAAKQVPVNYFDLAVKGGWVMIPIALLSVIAVYIFIERLMTLRNAGRIDHNFMNRIKGLHS